MPSSISKDPRSNLRRYKSSSANCSTASPFTSFTWYPVSASFKSGSSIPGPPPMSRWVEQPCVPDGKTSPPGCREGASTGDLVGGGVTVAGGEVVVLLAFGWYPPSLSLAPGAFDSLMRRSCSACRSAEFSAAMRLISRLVGYSETAGSRVWWTSLTSAAKGAERL